MNRRNQSMNDGVSYWSCGKRMHLRRDYLTLKNEKGKGIIVESTSDIATIVEVTWTILVMSYLLLRIRCLTDGLWTLVIRCTLHQ